MSLNNYLHEKYKLVTGLAPVLPASSTPDYVCLKNYERMTIVILVKNATTVTGSAITLKQATDVAGTGEKAVPFTKAWRNIDTAAADALAEFAVVSDTFTTDATNSKDLMYALDVDPSKDLDVDGGFDCVRAGTGNATAATLSVLYLLYAKDAKATPPSAIID